MVGQVQTKLGNVSYSMTFDEKDEMETMHRMAVLGNPPQYCHACQNNQYFALDSNKDKEGNTYINVVCKKCGAKAKLGKYKAGGYFWHKFEVYQRPGEQTTQAEPSQDIPAPGDDDLPF